VCQDASALGFEAASWLCTMLARPQTRMETIRRTLPTVFEVNGTTAPPSVVPTGEVSNEESSANAGERDLRRS